MHFQELILIGAGLFSIVASAADWDWFMNHRKARFFVKILGRTGARIFYALLGVFISSIGLLIGAGLLPR